MSTSKVKTIDEIKALIQSGQTEIHRNIQIWPEPVLSEQKSDYYATQDLTAGIADNPILALAREWNRITGMPVSTCFIHALGVVSCMAVRNFNIKRRGNHAMKCSAGMMVVTGHSASTGKSGFNSLATYEFHPCFENINKNNIIERMKMQKKVKLLKGELEKATNAKEVDSLITKISDAEYELRNGSFPQYRAMITNATPEALEGVAKEQDRCYWIISAEDGCMNTLTGNAYGGGNTHSNVDIILQGWDDEYISTSRANRVGYDGNVRGAIAAIAQERIVETIFGMADRGVGFTERFIMYCERDNLGNRDFMAAKSSVDNRILVNYNAMSRNIICETSNITLELSAEADAEITRIKSEYEAMMRPGAVFENRIMRQFVGKIDKHILKLAANLHLAHEWCPIDEPGKQIRNEPRRGNEVPIERIHEAHIIMKKVIRFYIQCLSAVGVRGASVELDTVSAKIKAKAEKGQRRITRKVLVDEIKGLSVFKQKRSTITEYLTVTLLPKLEEAGIICVNNNEIYINPKFA